MEISEVRKVANLARLSLTDQELESSRQQLGAILDYVRLLDEVNLDGVAPMPHPVPMNNVFREDVRQESLSREDSLANACKTDGQFFLVPRILEEKG
ncbi:MAG: Asp-tRNA(Asn)/Glu-tRNA(Gln) amidotransferase subunit GatC [Planctomycetaceae bacterium]|nr:Asp-tRNA(Asn)/Glu-tRNA(Gln) amidotransferase subunit GatC [Planctomycetaceae bacterium]